MTKVKRWPWAAAALLAAGCLLLCGCARPAQGYPLAGKKFAIVVKSDGNQFFDPIVEGFCAVVEERGGTPLIRQPAYVAAEEQITIVNELIAQGVDCIAIAANSEAAVAPVLKKAMEAGISVLSFDSAVSPGSRALHVNQADGRRIAEALMAAAADITGGSGQIAIMSTTNQANNQNLWIDEMRAILEDGVYPGLLLVHIAYGEDNYGTTYEKTQLLIDNYPELALVIAPTAAGIPAVAACITENGLAGRIKVTGLGMPSQMADYIGPDRVCPYMFLWDLEAVGRLTGYASVGLVERTIKGVPGETLAAGDLGEYKVEADRFGGNEIVLQADPIRFSSENIEAWKAVY